MLERAPAMLKLVSLQLVCVSAVVKCFTLLSIIPPKVILRLKLFSLQLVCVSAVVKCSTILSIIPPKI